MLSMFRKVCGIKCDDGLTFDSAALRVDVIRSHLGTCSVSRAYGVDGDQSTRDLTTPSQPAPPTQAPASADAPGEGGGLFGT